MARLNLKKYEDWMDAADEFPVSGFVTNTLGIVIEGYCPNAQVGAICSVESQDRSSSVLAEIVGFKDDKVILMPLADAKRIGMGSTIRMHDLQASFRCGPDLIGRVIDGLGNPLDDLPPPETDKRYSIYSRPINPLRRARITKPLDLGVKSINALLTVGQGQRISVMAGSGVGKSVLMGMIARSTSADVNVIALVGERGREVREFIEESLGKEGMKKSIVVVATSDSSPLVRMRAAFVATTVAEYFRSLNKNVLLMMDSVTRFAMAQREVGLAAGEPPTTKGYPPSVFTLLPRLFERVGNLESGGSITGIYTVLTEGDDINDPIGDAVRSIVDGHILLSRKLAALNHFPAIDVAYSTSRVMVDVSTKEQMDYAAKVKQILATYSEAEDLINIGAYVKGSNKSIDEAVKYIDPIRSFLKQPQNEKKTIAQSIKEMKAIFDPKGAAQ